VYQKAGNDNETVTLEILLELHLLGYSKDGFSETTESGNLRFFEQLIWLQYSRVNVV
jgi:hypothetical protein